MKQKYWMFKTIYICPVCGEETVYTEKMHTEKPKNKEECQEIRCDSSCQCIYYM